VVAENVEGFRVDVSFDGGVNWDRTGATTWSDIVTNATAHIKSITGYTSITTRRDWFRNIPCLLRIDLTTRTPIRRQEYNAAYTSRTYRTRTQVLMISPRNFGIGS
ncbi:MAG TPA: hypothetical protein VN436_08435, partial [Holophaga sp.]|nr:hypothetical protein [Holophaga sp.]